MTTSIHLRVYFSPVFPLFCGGITPLRKELTERTTEYSIFEPVKNRMVTGFVRYEAHSLNGNFESQRRISVLKTALDQSLFMLFSAFVMASDLKAGCKYPFLGSRWQRRLGSL